jgi:hypothetical protein
MNDSFKHDAKNSSANRRRDSRRASATESTVAGSINCVDFQFNTADRFNSPSLFAIFDV